MQVILVSSAGVERNAKIGDDEEARKKDIPIVQLNPGGARCPFSLALQVLNCCLGWSGIRPSHQWICC